MGIALWVIQVFLGLAFLAAGGMTLQQPLGLGFQSAWKLIG
ncbi:MAG TPA: hypothetical protein VG127_05120 [Rubrobacteraceae bacterium]|jgi:hypothetical protein|nr:hypothetical protein [Rubrobacteraceae bacterium]